MLYESSRRKPDWRFTAGASNNGAVVIERPSAPAKMCDFDDFKRSEDLFCLIFNSFVAMNCFILYWCFICTNFQLWADTNARLKYVRANLENVIFLGVSALRVSPAETRLTVYRRLQVLRVGTIHPYCRQRVFMMWGRFFEFLRSFLALDFVLNSFTAFFRCYFSGS